MTDGNLPGGVVVVPIHARPSGSGVAQIEMRTVPGVGLVLPVYSSIGSLVACCSEIQPWMALDADGLNEVRRVTEFDVIVRDVDLRGEADEPDDPSTPQSWLEEARP
ncbi:hypothetical protein FK531_20375 [Rhodococcus spelaei]|uniref:SseB protein N-terminal domain-containing protein n=1 Tax=Rhodococcus spelaei TaxID=2546320 RepID=A0A541B0F1_9NOCA|nr:SAV_915 family protein [Rhodococcus spelaei]TQF65788.1 hypothetical protein FK531_20375 [Rhodococcus spelaei]